MNKGYKVINVNTELRKGITWIAVDNWMPDMVCNTGYWGKPSGVSSTVGFWRITYKNLKG